MSTKQGAISKEKILTGNQAAAYGAYLSNVQVVSAYPITPQTSVIESLAELYLKADWPSRFVNVESEHSAMAACIGAAMAGARVFTATSSQGLALMHELLHWGAAQRLPIVMVNVNRAMAPGWNIWTDQNDSLSQRDTGWLQIYCASSQEVLDSVIQAYRVAETVQLPVMVVLDAFFLSHTAEAVEIPNREIIASFLPPRACAFKLDVEKPQAFGSLLSPDYYQEMRAKMHESMEDAHAVLEKAQQDWEKLTGRRYNALDPYQCEDADLILVTSGTVTGTAHEVVDSLRKRGVKVGALKMRLFRPTPVEELKKYLKGSTKVAVLDRNISFGHHGIFFQEIKSALYNLPEKKRPRLYGYVLGLGGRDVTREMIESVVDQTFSRENPDPESVWIGCR